MTGQDAGKSKQSEVDAARRALAFATATLTATPQRGTSPTNPTTRMQGETGQGEAEPAR